MKAVAEVIGVSRSNLIERLQGRPKKRLGRPPLPDDELVADIKAVIAGLPTYGYRRVHAILKRQALAAGRKPPNHKRVYRVMKVYGLLLDRHVGGVERRHDGRIAVDQRNRRWCSDGFEIGCDNGNSDRILDEQAFNRSVRPFSHVANTAALLINHFPSRCDTVTYDPGRKPGLVNIGELRLLNTFRPSTIMATTGDPTPFHDYMTYLIPDDGDRKEVLRWCATLIAKPEIKMSYGVLLISETQGIGKGTLGEAILTPLLGEANVSSPDEQEITESNFNGWIPHKRLAVGP